MSESDSSNTTNTSLSVFEKPYCLIENCPDQTLKICEEVLNELKQITRPVNVIAIVGPYRTGKSYLLNLLAGKRTGFPLGSSIRAKTKGIWVWCRPHPVRKDEILLLLDTEGLGDVNKGDEENDYWIFLLAVLLSCTLVYNNLSTISQDGITKLHYVTELKNRMKTRDTPKVEDGSDFFKFFPNFVWVLRDFVLNLEDEEGNPITADEYLAEALREKKGASPKVVEYNKPRQCIREFFEDKKCFVFPTPAESLTDLKNLEKLPDSKLQPEFLREAEAFSSYIYTRTFPKTAKGQPINGERLCHLLEMYLHEIQSGEIPCVENAVKRMAEKENDKAVKVSVKLYKDQMKELLQQSINTEDELASAHLDCSFKALERFMSLSMLDDKQKSQTHLKKKIGQKYKEICSQWEREHRGSESLNEEAEKKNKQLLIEVEETKQHMLLMKKKHIEEQENIMKEIERKQQQRENELKAMELKHEVSKALSQQVEQLALERRTAEVARQTITTGGEEYMGILFVAGSTFLGAIEGATYGASLGMLSANPFIAAAAAVGGTIVGGARGLVAGLSTAFIPTSWWSLW